MSMKETLGKYKKLYKEGHITKEEYDEKKKAFKAAMKSEKESMDRKKKIIIGGAAAIIVVAAAILIAVLIPKAEMEVQLVDEEAGEYLILNAPDDMDLEIDPGSGTAGTTLKVSDIYGEKVDTENENADGKVILHAPDEKYEKGEIYTSYAGKDGTFLNEEFKGAKKLTFVVEQKNTAEVEYMDDVKLPGEGEAEEKDGRITLEGKYGNGDVIVADGDGDGTPETYKLKDAGYSGGKTKAAYTEPECDEVYEKLDVFYYDEMDLSDAEINEDAVVEMLDDTGVLDIFVDEAYAGKKKDLVDVKFDNEKTFEVTVRDPKHKKRQLILRLGVEDKALIKVNKEMASVSNTLTLEPGIEVSIKGSVEKETEKKILEAIENYDGGTGGKASGYEDRDTIAELPVPIPAPVPIPIKAVIGLGTVTEFHAAAEFSARVDTSVTFTNGLVYSIEERKMIKKYSDIHGDIDTKIMVNGKLDAYAGLYMEANLVAMSCVKIGVRADGGPYFDAKGCFVIEGTPEKIDHKGYIESELGLKFNVNATAKVPVLKEKKFKIGSKKKPLIELSYSRKLKDTDIEESYILKDEGVYIGDIHAIYHDMIEDEEKKGIIKDYKMTLDGKEVKLEDGMLKGDFKEGKHTIGLEWERKGQKFSTEEETEFNDFDPWVKFAEASKYIGMSAQELMADFGMSTDLAYYADREYYPINGTDITVGFDDQLTEEVDLSTIIYMDSECTAIYGRAGDIFGVDEKFSISEAENIFGTELKFYDPPRDAFMEEVYYMGGFDYGGRHYSITFAVMRDGQMIDPYSVCEIHAE